MSRLPKEILTFVQKSPYFSHQEERSLYKELYLYFEEESDKYVISYHKSDSKYPYRANVFSPLWLREILFNMYKIHFKNQHLRTVVNKENRISPDTIAYVCALYYNNHFILDRIAKGRNQFYMFYIKNGHLDFAEAFKKMTEENGYKCDVTPVSNELLIEVETKEW